MKKTKMPKGFAHGITGQLFEENGNSGGIYNFIGDLCKEFSRTKDEVMAETRKDFRLNILEKTKDPDMRKELEDLWNSIADAYSNVILTIGFALGQRIDILTPEAQKEIGYVWKRLKEDNIFFVYPREKAA